MNTRFLTILFSLFLSAPIPAVAVESHPPLVPQGERIENVTEAISDFLGLRIVTDLAFSPDGKVLAVADGSERVRLWTVADGREIFRFPAPEERLYSVDISPDGTLIAAGASNGRIRVWRMSDGKEIRHFQQDEKCGSLDFGPDSETLASGGADTVYVWRVAQHSGPVILPHPKTVSSVRFAPKGKAVITSAHDRILRVWNAETGALARASGPLCIYESRRGYSKGVGKNTERRQFDYCDCAMRFSSTGTRVAGKWRECSVFLWDVASGLVVARFEDLSVRIGELALHPDGKTIAAATDGDEIIMWDMVAGWPTAVIPTDGRARTLRFSPDGKVLAFRSGDSGIHLWDVENRRELKAMASHRILFLSLDISPDGGYLASTSRDEILRIWDLHPYRELRRLEGAGGRTVRFSPDGKTVASAFRDGRLGFHDVATGSALRELRTESDGVFQFSPDGKIVAVPGGRIGDTGDFPIAFMDIGSGKTIRELRGHPGPIESIDFSPDGRFLLSSARDKTIRLWDVATGAELRRIGDDHGRPRLTFDAGFYSPAYAAFSPVGGRFASVLPYSGIQIWRTDRREEVDRIQGIGNWMMPWLNDVGMKIDVVMHLMSNNGWLNRSQKKALEWLYDHSIAPYSVTFSPDGSIIAASRFPEGIQLWDAAAGRPIRLLKTGRNSLILESRFTPDGRVIAACNLFFDNVLRLWDVASGELAAVFTAGGNGVWAAVDLRDGKTYRYDDGTFLQRGTAGRRTPIPVRPPRDRAAQREEEG